MFSYYIFTLIKLLLKIDSYIQSFTFACTFYQKFKALSSTSTDSSLQLPVSSGKYGGVSSRYAKQTRRDVISSRKTACSHLYLKIN